MIKTADEFVALRTSDNLDEQYRAGHDSADINVWLDVINSYPDYKAWVVYNKTIQIEILELLCTDEDPEVRADVARKRKINDYIFKTLVIDPNEDVRYALICNTKLTLKQLEAIKVDDSSWLMTQKSIKTNEISH